MTKALGRGVIGLGLNALYASYPKLKVSPTETHSTSRPTAPAASARGPIYNGRVLLPGSPLGACTEQ
jgi:hypothetical protein